MQPSGPNSSVPPYEPKLRHIILKTALTALLLLSALALCLGLLLPGLAGIALTSVPIFHLSLRPRLGEVTVTLLAGLIFGSSYVWFFKIPLNLGPSPVFLLEILGAGSLAVLIVRALWTTREEKQRVLSVLFPSVGLLVFLIVKQQLLNIGALQGATYDLHLFLVDGSLGLYVFQFFRGFLVTPAVRWCMLVVYGSLPIAMAILYTAHLRKLNSRYYLLQLFLIAGFLGWALYNLLPAAGPAYFLGPDIARTLPSYDQLRLVQIQRVPMPSSVFRNAIPSLHMSWALLLVWNSRVLSRSVRLFAVAFAVLTAVATLATGEHYLIDLIVAFPFSLLVLSLCTKNLTNPWPKRIGLLCGAFMTLGWMLVIRTAPKIFLASKLLPWTCFLVTLVFTQMCFRKIDSAADSIFWNAEKSETEQGSPSLRRLSQSVGTL